MSKPKCYACNDTGVIRNILERKTEACGCENEIDNVEKLRAEIKSETERCLYWEKTAYEYRAESDRNRNLLTEAHAIIGRLTHCMSQRMDSASISPYMSGIQPK